MSTPKTGDSKSAYFTMEEMEQQWKKFEQLNESIKANTTTEKKKKIPDLKIRETDKNKESEYRTVSITQIDMEENKESQCAEIFSSTTPVITPRSANLKNSNGSSSSSESPRNHNKFKDTPRRSYVNRSHNSPSSLQPSLINMSHIKAEENSNTSNKNSPRKVGREFNKKISKKFTEFKLNIGNISRRGASSPRSASSPKSGGRVSSVEMSPEKENANVLSEISFNVRNKAAKAYIQLRKEEIFIRAGDKRKSMLIEAKMMVVLKDEKIQITDEKIQALIDDAKIRSQYAEIEVEIDLTKGPFPDLVEEGSKKFITRWETDNFDRGAVFAGLPSEEKNKMDASFMPTFIADYYREGVSHELLLADGKTRKFSSPIELADYLNKNCKDAHRSRYISNVTSQNIVTLLQQWTCGGLPGTTSPIKLYDGTPLVPRGRTEQRFVYKVQEDGTVEVKVTVSIYANNQGNAARASQLQSASRDQVFIDEDAKLTIDTTLRFEVDDEWSIDNPRLKASGWNLAAER